MFEPFFHALKTELEARQRRRREAERALASEGIAVAQMPFNALFDEQLKGRFRHVNVQLRDDDTLDFRVFIAGRVVAQRLHLDRFVVTPRRAEVRLHTNGVFQAPFFGTVAAGWARAVLVATFGPEIGLPWGTDVVRQGVAEIVVDLRAGDLGPLFAENPDQWERCSIHGVGIQEGALRVFGGPAARPA